MADTRVGGLIGLNQGKVMFFLTALFIITKYLNRRLFVYKMINNIRIFCF